MTQFVDDHLSAGTAPEVEAVELGPTASERGRSFKQRVFASQLLIVAVVLAGWQWLPSVGFIHSTFSFMDPFFISSPSRVGKELWLLVSGASGATEIWGPLARTVLTAIVGTIVACIAGAVCGLLVSNWVFLEAVTRPFAVFLNAVPRIAMIPIIILLIGPSIQADIVTAVTVVFFLIFYNAYAGAASVPMEMIHNAELLGASKSTVMWAVRWPYALAWTMMALPNAIAVGLVGTVTTELFTGGGGLGYQLVLAIYNSNATLLFAVVVILSFVGVVLVLGFSRLERVLLPWWEKSTGA